MKKKITKVVAIMMVAGIVLTGNVASARSSVTRYAAYGSKNVIMTCQFLTGQVIIEGSIEHSDRSTPIYLYAKPAGYYKSGTKKMVCWAKKPVSGMGVLASTNAFTTNGKKFYSAKCDYRYGKSSKSYSKVTIPEFKY